MNEKELIEKIKWSIHINKMTKEINGDNTSINVNVLKEILNLIKKHQTEIERLKLLLAETNAQFLNSDLKAKRKNEEDLEMLYKGCQAEIETLKRDFEIVDHECNRLEQEDIKKDKIIDLMARAIDNYDSQLEINNFKNKEHIKEVFERSIEQ